MPPKARIDDDSFQRILSALEPDQIRQLDSASTTDLIWAYLCVLMNKANNAENRRACHDVYKRRRAKFQPFINQLLEKYATQASNHQSGFIDVCIKVEMSLSFVFFIISLSGTIGRNESE